MAKYKVKAPTNVNGLNWGLLFTNGVSNDFDDKVLFDKLVRKGYVPVKDKGKKETETDPKNNPDNQKEQ